MRSAQYWTFQGVSHHPKVAQQEITELTNLAAGLLAFERAYTHTHGERTPVFRLLSMINEAIAENVKEIEAALKDGTLDHRISEMLSQDGRDGIPF